MWGTWEKAIFLMFMSDDVCEIKIVFFGGG